MDRLTALLGVVRAFALVGRSRATHHRQANPTLRPYGPHPKARHPAELTAAERAAILEVLTSDGYADLSVAQVWAREFDAGRYYCSQRTMHRILAAHRMNGERRRHATHPPRKIPELVTTRQNDVWSSRGYHENAGPDQGHLVPRSRRHRHLLPLRRGLVHRDRRRRRTSR
ncbi:putative transposase (plasmid) [Rhodococcus erythropolis PR4]|uniref:Putative transposase n=1 Tax=Rhodococcus erythropolis (strain PR4 / NBRC 100887) TaxID=234621 RepID=Q3L981_RHOE4|nr:putative transposase [Rhodococcus erythropolis PR4]